MSNWLDEFMKNYSKYKRIIKCTEKDDISEQAICLLKLNTPKKKKKKRKTKRR